MSYIADRTVEGEIIGPGSMNVEVWGPEWEWREPPRGVVGNHLSGHFLMTIREVWESKLNETERAQALAQHARCTRGRVKEIQDLWITVATGHVRRPRNFAKEVSSETLVIGVTSRMAGVTQIVPITLCFASFDMKGRHCWKCSSHNRPAHLWKQGYRPNRLVTEEELNELRTKWCARMGGSFIVGQRRELHAMDGYCGASTRKVALPMQAVFRSRIARRKRQPREEKKGTMKVPSMPYASYFMEDSGEDSEGYVAEQAKRRRTTAAGEDLKPAAKKPKTG